MNYISLPVEIKFKIFTFIKPCILLRYKTINIDFYDHIKSYIMHKINFSPIFKNYLNINTLRGILNENCIISGSSILKFLLDDTFETNDIDIFTTIENSENILNFLEENSYEYTHHLSDYEVDESIILYKTYTNKEEKVIQIIFCKDPKNHVKKFDFEIVKNYYDGKNIIISKKDLETKKEIIVARNFFMCSRIRLYKYLERGFEITVRKR